MKERVKKTGSRFFTAVVLCSLLFNGLTGCGNASDSVSKSNTAWMAEESGRNGSAAYGLADNGEAKASVADMDELEDEAASDTMGTADSDGSAASAGIQGSNKKIVRTYDYTYETEEFDGAYTYLKEQIAKYEGYISSSQVEGANYRTLHLTARIPAEASDVFADTMGNLGTVINQSESAEDITLQYTDTESRIASLKTEQERLNALLEKADNLESIIALEERLTEVRYEMENYQSRKNLYDDWVTYSTFTIILHEVNYTVAVDDSTFFSRISTGLEVSFRDIKNGFVDFVVWLIVILPYLMIWGAVLVAAIWIIRKIIQNRRKKKKEIKEIPDEKKEPKHKKKDEKTI